MRLNPAAVHARGSHDDMYAAFGPQRSGKSNWLATVGLEAPGACLFTSTRADLAVHTAAARARKGPVWFLNPGLDGGFPADLCWSPLAGCEDYRMAMESAGALIHASPRNTDGSSNWIDAESKRMLQYLLHAAALGRLDIRAVRLWAGTPAGMTEPVKILDAAGNGAWAQSLEDMSARAAAEPQFAEGLGGGAGAALAWLDDLVLAALACPEPGQEFDAAGFIREPGTVYLIGADSPNCPLSPYFACFATCLWNTAKRMAADPDEPASRGLKLDPRLFMIIDEPAITCPVPLDRWATEAAGHGIVLVTGFQSDAQLPMRFGEHGGRTLEALLNTRIVFGGDPAIAEKAARWGGERDTWDQVKASDGTKTRSPRQELAFPPERICHLPLGKAFVKHRYTRGFIADIPRVQDHPLYEAADPRDFWDVPPKTRQQEALAGALLFLVLAAMVRRPLPQPQRPAIEAPRRDPIATPYTPPAAQSPPAAAPVPFLTEEVLPCPVPRHRVRAAR